MCFLVHKIISKQECTIFTTMFLPMQKTPTDRLEIKSIRAKKKDKTKGKKKGNKKTNRKVKKTIENLHKR
jgi:F0F1-type ATP synthase epsilon subunit